MRDAIREGLEKADFAVDAFELADEANAAISTTKYDAVILDLGLPNGDGIDLLKSWRDRGETVPVLILTTGDTLKDRVSGLDSGADVYLPKPFAMEEVLARIRALLRRLGATLGVVLTAGNISFDVTSRLRKRLTNVEAMVSIHTLRGVGYLMIANEK